MRKREGKKKRMEILPKLIEERRKGEEGKKGIGEEEKEEG